MRDREQASTVPDVSEHLCLPGIHTKVDCKKHLDLLNYLQYTYLDMPFTIMNEFASTEESNMSKPLPVGKTNIHKWCTTC